jgi:hypothetical protein
MALSESKVKHRDPPLIVPRELVGREYACTNCGAWHPIDWLEKKPYPKDSIKSTVAVGHWVPVSFLNTCPACNQRNHLVAETKHFHGQLLISADEAGREIGDISMFLLAGCGISHDKRKSIEADVRLLERELADASGGRITAFHAKEIMDRKMWPEASLSIRIKYVRRMAKIAKTNRVSKFVTAGAVRGSDALGKRYLRDEVFTAYTMRTLQRCTDLGIRPTFGFDQVQRGKKNGWAEECMVGIRRYPLFVWFSRGAHIAEIEHVKPGSTTESKLADCLAFVTARELEQRLAKRFVDVDTQWYGYSQFSGYDGKGDLIFSDGIGFPWRQVFGFKSAR